MVFIVAEVDEKGHYEHTHEAYEYQYPFAIFLLFDPWNPEDKDVYVPQKVHTYVRPRTLMLCHARACTPLGLAPLDCRLLVTCSSCQFSE